jgi:hypothetical protein
MDQWLVPAEWLIPAAAFSLFAGFLWGRPLEAWDWRMSGDSHHHAHKSGGRWWRVEPEDGSREET